MANIFAEAFREAGLIDEKKYKELKKQDELKGKKNEYGEFVDIYIKGFFINGEVNSELFNQIAIDVVHLFKGSKLTTTKLRQYYDLINNLYKNKSYKNINHLKSELYIILAKANYDYNRKNIVPFSFIQFLKFNFNEFLFKKGDKKIDEKFKVFKKHFEAVVAYAKGVLKDK